jgi:ATP-dependent 26S proteasome regulatory subunit
MSPTLTALKQMLEETETELYDTTLDLTIAKQHQQMLSNEIERLKAEIKAAKQPETAVGQVWFGTHNGQTYIVAAHTIEDRYVLINLKSGSRYVTPGEDPFAGDKANFTFIGMARDAVKVEQP